ncbi:MAG: DUF4065 domain-containing protein [Tannerella sp.]|nr:DUF4065 domain-containing protein [Tannerella sp.]
MEPVSVKDVAAYIILKKGHITAIKLEKLVYYCQAWSLVWDGEPLFHERIEAWANGPVVPALFAEHKGLFMVNRINGNPEKLTAIQKETVDAVFRDYADQSAFWLVELSHQEAPWRNARGELRIGAKCSNEITHAAMAEYYSGLIPA